MEKKVRFIKENDLIPFWKIGDEFEIQFSFDKNLWAFINDQREIVFTLNNHQTNLQDLKNKGYIKII